MYQLDCLQQKAFDDSVNFLKSGRQKGICVYSGGGGKSVIIAKVAEYVARHPDYRVLIVTHRKELLLQNEAKVQGVECGIVSSSLNRYEYDSQIVIGGIATIYNKKEKLGEFKLIIIDECQRISNSPDSNSMYWQLLKAYPDAKVLGFTALPIRLQDGSLTWGSTYHITTYQDLLDEGFITPMSNKPLFRPDLSQVARNIKGDYKMDDFVRKCYGRDDITGNYNGDLILKTCNQVKSFFVSHKLKKFIDFCPTVDYARVILFEYIEQGFRMQSEDGLTAILTGDMKKTERDEVVKRYRAGEYDGIVNVEIATEGFDDPEIDLVVVRRATDSLSLWQQILYRGVRLVNPTIRSLPTKEERIEAIKKSSKPVCYLLDFANNLKKHGGLIDTSWQFLSGRPVLQKKSLHKICPMCEEYVPLTAKICPDCTYIFLKEDEKPIEHEYDFDAKTDINKPKDPFILFYIDEVIYDDKFISKKGHKGWRITYKCGMEFISEFVYGAANKNKWLLKRGHKFPAKINWGNLKTPIKLKAIKQKGSKYYNIIELLW